MNKYMVKQRGFVRRLERRLEHRMTRRGEVNPRIEELTDEDLDIIVTEFWEEISFCLRSGVRVVFEGWASFFTNPVKRKCYDISKSRNWWTWKYRVRMNPLDLFREQAEKEITEAEYEAIKEAKQKKNTTESSAS